MRFAVPIAPKARAPILSARLVRPAASAWVISTVRAPYPNGISTKEVGLASGEALENRPGLPKTMELPGFDWGGGGDFPGSEERKVNGYMVYVYVHIGGAEGFSNTACDVACGTMAGSDTGGFTVYRARAELGLLNLHDA